MTALYAMTPNPECTVCFGSGTDPVFFGDCTECWPNARLTHQREELWHAHRQRWAIELAAEEASERVAAEASRLRRQAWRTRPGNAAGLRSI